MFEDKDFNKTGFNAESTMMKESYDEMLDEMGAAVLKGYDASRLLEETDPIAYQVGMNDYESSLLSDIQSGYTENSKIFDEDENLTTYGENVLKEMYDDMLDEMGVEVMLNNYDASRLLEETDPIAYQVGLNDYESSMESDMEDDMSPYEKIARRNVGMAESSLTRLTSDHPKFDPQKADRNKDGKISSWERTVGNEVAKSMGAETDEKKLVELLVEYNLPGDPEYIYDLLEGANMKIIKMKDYYDAESFNAETFEAKVGNPQYKKSFGKMMAKYDIETNPEKKAKILTEMKRKFPAFFGAETFEASGTKKPKLTPAQLRMLNHLRYSLKESQKYSPSIPYAYFHIKRDYYERTSRNQAKHLNALLDKGLINIKSPSNPNERFKIGEAYEITLNPMADEYKYKPPSWAKNAESFEAKGIDTFAKPFEEIGISLPYARLGVMAAGLTALAFGVKKYMKK